MARWRRQATTLLQMHTDAIEALDETMAGYEQDIAALSIELSNLEREVNDQGDVCDGRMEFTLGAIQGINDRINERVTVSITDAAQIVELTQMLEGFMRSTIDRFDAMDTLFKAHVGPID